MSAAFAAPVVAWATSTDPEAPLVVLLHGRGSDERSMLGLVEHLPTSLNYASVRAPIAAGDGYAWFENRSTGRPTAASLRQTMGWFGAWIDDISASAERAA